MNSGIPYERRRRANAALMRSAATHTGQADMLLGTADAATGRIARFRDDDQNLAVVQDAWAEAHSSEIQASEHTADAAALRAQAASLYSPTAPHGPATVSPAASGPRPGVRPAPAQQSRSRPRAGR